MVRLFRGTCLAVRAMHEYRPSTPGSAMPTNRNGTTDPSASSTRKSKQDEDDEDNDERFPQAEGDAEGGYSYDGGLGSSVPLVTKHRAEEDGPENDVVFDGDEELHQQQEANSTLAVVPYAHRDLKPG